MSTKLYLAAMSGTAGLSYSNPEGGRMKETAVGGKGRHRTAFLAVSAACAAAMVWMTGPYLLSLYLGATLAVLGYPAYHWLHGKGWRPWASAAAVTAATLLLVFSPLVGLSMMAVTEGGKIVGEMARPEQSPAKALSEALGRRPELRRLVGDSRRLEERMNSALRAAGQAASAVVFRFAKEIPEFLLQVALAFLAFYFFLVDGPRVRDAALRLGALDHGVQGELMKTLRDSTVSTVMAGLVAALVQAGLILAAFLLLGVPGAFFAGGLTFLFAWIPLVGTAPATVAGAAYLFSQEAWGRLAAMGVLGLLASVADSIVRPYVLKGREGMHPLLGFVAVVGGIRVFGMLGVFIGPILASLLVSLARMWPLVRDGGERIPR